MPEKEPTEISSAAELALKVISHAEGEATVRLASAAREAGKLLAEATAEALKVVTIQNDADHDLLIELRTKMVGLKEAIEKLETGITLQVGDHEKRICALEKTDNVQAGRAGISTPVLIMVAGLVGGLVVFIIQQIITK